jgi:hypothetical protein
MSSSVYYADPGFITILEVFHQPLGWLKYAGVD